MKHICLTLNKIGTLRLTATVQSNHHNQTAECQQENMQGVLMLYLLYIRACCCYMGSESDILTPGNLKVTWSRWHHVPRLCLTLCSWMVADLSIQS